METFNRSKFRNPWISELVFLILKNLIEVALYFIIQSQFTLKLSGLEELHLHFIE